MIPAVLAVLEVIVNSRLLLALIVCFSMPVKSDEIPAPPDSQVSSISTSVTSLGLHMKISKFVSDSSVDEVLQFYKDYWKDEAAESTMLPWKMIGTRQGDEFLNVQVQAGDRDKSWGYLSRSDLPKQLDDKTYSMPNARSANFPMMSGSRVMDDQYSNDPGKKGRTLLLENDFSANTNHTFYRNHFKNKGWDIVMDEATSKRNSSYALFVRKGSKTVAVTIAKLNNKTSIVANEVTKGLLQ